MFEPSRRSKKREGRSAGKNTSFRMTGRSGRTDGWLCEFRAITPGEEKKHDRYGWKYDAAEFWHLSLGGDGWAMGEGGPRIWTTPSYMCGKEGNGPDSGTLINQRFFRNGKLVGVEGEGKSETWNSIYIDNWYMIMNGIHFRHHWISPYDLYGELTWIKCKQKDSGERGDIFHGREEDIDGRKYQC